MHFFAEINYMATSREDCKKWKDNPLKNPLTNRSIKQMDLLLQNYLNHVLKSTENILRIYWINH